MFKHILVPVAPSHTDEYSAAVDAARKLLDDDGKISVLSVVEEIPTYMGAYFPANFKEERVAETAQEMLDEFADQGVEPHVVSGHSANTILSWAGDHGVDCIVVSSHRPGFGDFFLGSTASRVVRHSQCAVMVLR